MLSHRLHLCALTLTAALSLSSCGLTNDQGPDVTQIATDANAEYSNPTIPISFNADEEMGQVNGHSDLGTTNKTEFLTTLEAVKNQLATITETHNIPTLGTVTGIIDGVDVSATSGAHHVQELASLMNFTEGVRSVRFDHHMLIAETDSEDNVASVFDYIRGLDSTVMKEYNLTISYPIDGTTRFHTINHLGPETTLHMDEAADDFAAMVSVRHAGLEYDGIADVHVPEYDATKNTALFELTCNREDNRPTESVLIDGQQLAQQYKDSQKWQVRVTSRNECIMKDS